MSGAKVPSPAPLPDGFDGGRRSFVNACDACIPTELCPKHQRSVEMGYARRAAELQDVVAGAQELADSATLVTA